MSSVWINPMNGQQIVADSSPGYMWTCLGAAGSDWIVNEQNRPGVAPGPNAQDVDLSVPLDFTPEDDQF